MRHRSLLCVFVLVICTVFNLRAQVQPPPDQLQISPPPPHRVEPPAANATVEELESQGDRLRGEKAYLDALDYYHAALKKKPDSAPLYNKAGITLLLMQRFKEAKKNFERAIKNDRQFADAYNNLGVVDYEERNYGKAVKRYLRAIELRSDAASYYSNLGAAYFSKKDFDKAAVCYAQAVQLDPDVLERTSRAGVTASLPSPEDRARYDYVLARLYAKIGVADRSLIHLRRAVEEGYKDINNVYKDIEFAELRKNPRFIELMAARPVAIPD
jgi:tetratricopeptide (TPR) repeat protein